MKKPPITGNVQPMYKTWLSKTEAMSYLDCGERLLEVLRGKGEVVFSQYGKKIWYNAASLNNFLERHKPIKNKDSIK